MTRTVADAAALLNVLAGEDEEDPSTWCRDIPRDYTDYLDADGLRGLRLGINRGYYDDFSEEQKAVAEGAYRVMERCGAILVQDTNLPHLRSDSSILLYEFKMCLNAYLSTNPALKCRTLKEIIDFYGDHPKEGLKYGMGILLDAEYNTSGACTDPKYILDKAACQRGAQEEGLLKLMDGHKLDVLVCPGITDCSPISGYPSIIVPAGYTSDNMPFGVTFVGRPFSEPTLIRAAYAFEQAARARLQANAVLVFRRHQLVDGVHGLLRRTIHVKGFNQVFRRLPAAHFFQSGGQILRRLASETPYQRLGRFVPDVHGIGQRAVQVENRPLYPHCPTNFSASARSRSAAARTSSAA